MNADQPGKARNERARRRTQRCPVDLGELEDRGGLLTCTTCDWAAGQHERVSR